MRPTQLRLSHSLRPNNSNLLKASQPESNLPKQMQQQTSSSNSSSHLQKTLSQITTLELTTTEMETVMVMETLVQVMVAKNLPLSESAGW